MNNNWNYGNLLDAIIKVVPGDRPALIHGERVIDWQTFDRRSNNLAAGLLAGGARFGDKVAIYMRNRAEYCEALAAVFKARLVHVNVNYRYIDDELVYLMDNADASVCIYAAEFAPHIAKIKTRLPLVKQWVEVDDGYPGIEDALFYEAMAETGDGAPLRIEREPNDMLFLYTGGTTGMPKGVMWGLSDMWLALGGGGNLRLGIPPCENVEDLLNRVKVNPPPVQLPLPPIMHGTGLVGAINALITGGTCVTLQSRSFEAELALEAIDKHGVTGVTIVGDAFARPIVEALDDNPGKYNFSSVKIISSAGVMWTKEVKAGLLRHNENLLLVDGFSSSEAIGMGSSIMTRDEVIEVAKFTISPTCKVFTEDFREVEPGSDEPGMVAVCGHLPLGYYKDQEKTDRTFKTINGVRYSIPGDWVKVEADGNLILLGRGSNCINTAGEKVYPEEVEEALKKHESVVDCLVVGVRDDRWGQSITAVVQLDAGYELEENELRDFSRQHLAGYKIPKRILAKEDLERAPNGKANYKVILEFAEKTLAG